MLHSQRTNPAHDPLSRRHRLHASPLVGWFLNSAVRRACHTGEGCRLNIDHLARSDNLELIMLTCLLTVKLFNDAATLRLSFSIRFTVLINVWLCKTDPVVPPTEDTSMSANRSVSAGSERLIWAVSA